MTLNSCQVICPVYLVQRVTPRVTHVKPHPLTPPTNPPPLHLYTSQQKTVVQCTLSIESSSPARARWEIFHAEKLCRIFMHSMGTGSVTTVCMCVCVCVCVHTLQDYRSNEGLLPSLLSLSPSPCWVVLMRAGGHFAGAVFKG